MRREEGKPKAIREARPPLAVGARARASQATAAAAATAPVMQEAAVEETMPQCLVAVVVAWDAAAATAQADWAPAAAAARARELLPRHPPRGTRRGGNRRVHAVSTSPPWFSPNARPWVGRTEMPVNTALISHLILST